MKYLLYILTIASLHSYSQTLEQAAIKIFLTCGGGNTSPEFDIYKNAIDSSKYDMLKQKLFSGNLIDEVFATIALIELNKAKRTSLNEKELAKIKEIKQSTKTYYFCWTCLDRDQGKLKELFKKGNATYLVIKSAIGLTASG